MHLCNIFTKSKELLLVDIPLFLEHLEPFLKLKRMRPPFVCAIGWLERNRLVTDFEEGKLGLEIEDVRRSRLFSWFMFQSYECLVRVR